MTITIHNDLDQGSPAWFAARCGLITASEMHLVLTPTLKVAANEKTRAHVDELLAQRITRHVEPSYIGDDMLRGLQDENTARDLYSDRYAPVTEIGFVTNDRWGFTLGCSPDGLIGDDGLWECKSRRQKFQIATIAAGTMPGDYMLQVQTQLLVTERAWCDFTSFSGGLPMFTARILPDQVIQAAIIAACAAFEGLVADKWTAYRATLATHPRLIPTERRIEQEMFL